MARKTFKFRLYPNRQQRDTLTATLDVCRELYNAGLQERIEAWKNRTPVRCYDQINQLPDIKQVREDVAGVFSQVLQDTLRRLDKTYKTFFGRVKRGQKAGFPRFKGRNRYDSFTYPQSGFELNGKLQLSKIGNIKIKQHRDRPGFHKDRFETRARNPRLGSMLGALVPRWEILDQYGSPFRIARGPGQCR